MYETTNLIDKHQKDTDNKDTMHFCTSIKSCKWQVQRRMKRIRERGKEGFADTDDEEEEAGEEEEPIGEDGEGEEEQAGEGRVNFAWIWDVKILKSNKVFW